MNYYVSYWHFDFILGNGDIDNHWENLTDSITKYEAVVLYRYLRMVMSEVNCAPSGNVAEETGCKADYEIFQQVFHKYVIKNKRQLLILELPLIDSFTFVRIKERELWRFRHN